MCECMKLHGASTLVLNLPASTDLKTVIDDLLVWARGSGVSVTGDEERLARGLIGEVFSACARTNDLPALSRVLALALRMFVVEERHLLATKEAEQRFPRETAGVRG